MNTKHTPGPWNVAHYGDTLKPYIKKGELTIAMIQESEANARLIAAAPDLLEALQGILGLVPMLGDAPFRKDIEAICNRAISKATGGSK